MKNLFEFYGIQSPLRQELVKGVLKRFQIKEFHEIESNIKNLLEVPQRECHYAALDLAIRFAAKAPYEYIDLYEYMIVKNSWWDTVDIIASTLHGKHFTKFPELIESKTSSWINSENLWLKRSCILFQLKYKEKTDKDLLSSFIQKCLNSKEFFINKAIGWSLREYSKTNPDWVINFVKSNELTPLSEKEALRIIKKRTKA